MKNEARKPQRDVRRESIPRRKLEYDPNTPGAIECRADSDPATREARVAKKAEELGRLFGVPAERRRRKPAKALPAALAKVSGVFEGKDEQDVVGGWKL